MTTKKTFNPAQYTAATCFFFLAAVLCFGASGKDDTELQRIFQRMDAAGKTFRSFTAQFTQIKYTKILKDFSTPEAGTFCYTRAKDGSALVRQETASPGKKILTVKGDKAVFCQPDIKQCQIISLGNYKNLTGYLAIGIGQSAAKLEKDFDISYQGSEPVNGEPCSMLLLKPRSDKVKAHVLEITLWIKKSNGILVQNKLLEPTGDYTLLTFSNEKLNVPIPDAMFEQKIPKDFDKQTI
jgi:outer membrane lipoprotein-sorting protein